MIALYLVITSILSRKGRANKLEYQKLIGYRQKVYENQFPTSWPFWVSNLLILNENQKANQEANSRLLKTLF